MLESDMKTLTLISYEADGDCRLTVAPHNVDFVIAKIGCVEIRGNLLKNATIFFSDGNNVQVNVTDLDLTTLEEAIGSYVF
jgi:hypothetical protein